MGTRVEPKQGGGEGPSLCTGAFDLHGRCLGPFTYSPREQSSVWPEVIDLKLWVKAEWKFQTRGQPCSNSALRKGKPQGLRTVPSRNHCPPHLPQPWGLTTHSASPSCSQWEARSWSTHTASLLSGRRLASYSFWVPVTALSLALWEGGLTAPLGCQSQAQHQPLVGTA